MKETEVFPGMVTQMIGVGEQTGAMDAMLQKIADFYEDEVDAAVKDLLTALEPVMIVFLGVVVGGVVISMYLPLFSLIGKLSGTLDRDSNRRCYIGVSAGQAAELPALAYFWPTVSCLKECKPAERARCRCDGIRTLDHARSGWIG